MAASKTAKVELRPAAASVDVRLVRAEDADPQLPAPAAINAAEADAAAATLEAEDGEPDVLAPAPAALQALVPAALGPELDEDFGLVDLLAPAVQALDVRLSP